MANLRWCSYAFCLALVIQHRLRLLARPIDLRLDRRLIGYRRYSLWPILLRVHRPLTSRHRRLPLQKHMGPFGFRLALLLSIGLDSVEKLLP